MEFFPRCQNGGKNSLEDADRPARASVSGGGSSVCPDDGANAAGVSLRLRRVRVLHWWTGRELS